MMKQLSDIALAAPRINQEPGAMPGEGLTALQTFSYFVAAPTVLFVVISALVCVLDGGRKKNRASASVITHIE